jgi:hypothetical protein
MIFFCYVDDRFEVVNMLEGHRDIMAYFDDNSVLFHSSAPCQRGLVHI